jgi:hypothetical protein
MSKSIFFTGQPIFTQLLKYVPRDMVYRISRDLKADYYCKRFNSHDHLVTLLFATFNNCDSLREVTTGMLALQQRLNHLGLKHFPRRSTLSDANKRRSADVFEKIYTELLNRYSHFLSDSRLKKHESRLYIFDSTTITLFQEVLQGTGLVGLNGKRKGGIKVHTLMKSNQDVPCMVRFSASAKPDSIFLKEVDLPKGSIVIFDRGYNQYATFNRFTEQGVRWVTRLRQSAALHVIEDKFVTDGQKQKGIISDQIIMLGHCNRTDKRRVKVNARLITYKDPQSSECFRFVTNDPRMAPSTIAGIYRKRWQIEILFKRLKQNYPLKYFLGENENAIKIQIWCSLIADLLLKVIKKGCAARWAFSNLTSMVRLHLMTYIDLLAFLHCPEKSLLSMINRKNDNPNTALLFST